MFLSVTSAYAKVILPDVFSDNMVLQQQTSVALWGKSKPGTTTIISTSWDRKTYGAKADANGRWTVKVSTSKAGGPFKISFNDGDELTLKNILIGEVWVCSGQSNMQMPLRGNGSPIFNSSEIIMNADNDNLRLFKVGKATLSEPSRELKGEWSISNSESAREFSALAFQFGQILQKKLKVPVGIILSTYVGTTIEAWMSNPSLKSFPEIEILANLDTAKQKQRYATTLFNGMISPIVGYGIKGLLWMQGESNRHNPHLYENYLPAMVSDWRKQWALGDLPFYFIQIAPFDSKDKKRSGPRLREAQLNASKVIPNCGMVVSLDVGMENDIHFMDKTTLAQRSSYWAVGHTYGVKGINYKSPEFNSMKIDGNQCVLTFDNAPYLTSYKKPITLFEVAGEDKIFYPATAEINTNMVTVKSEKVAKPVAVRYAYKEFVKGELYNNDGLPASSFRTDNWKLGYEK